MLEPTTIYWQNKKDTEYRMKAEDEVESKVYNKKYTWAYMANILYDWDNVKFGNVVPFIGFGVGYCQNTMHGKIKTDDKSQNEKLKEDRLAYQGILGFTWPVKEGISLRGEYHYFCGRSHTKDHSIEAKLVKTF